MTGGCGFLGSNIVRKLNAKEQQVVIVDNYDEFKFKNLRSLQFADYISYKQGISSLKAALSKHEFSAIIHIGANADVLERNADIMLSSNYEHSKLYLELAQERNIPLVYASSSAVYGNAPKIDDINQEDPHNIYAWSKWLFDKYVAANLSGYANKVIGLRLFNIFGMGEFHKGKNASLPLRFFSFIRDNGFIDLFDRTIHRDYVWVEDVADVFLALLEETSIENGIYDLGGNNPLSHREVAELVAEAFIEKGLKQEETELIKSVPMPEELVHNFQFYTKANNLLPLIEKKTRGNKEKMKTYINQLIDVNYGIGKI